MQFDLSIYSHDKIVYQGKVSSLSSTNEVGIFDILPEHTNFISVVQNELKLRFENGSERTLTLTRGVLRCFATQVDVYLEI